MSSRRRLERGGIDAAGEALARAFQDDAVYGSLWPDPDRRSRALRAFLTVPLADAYDHGQVDVVEEEDRILAVAAWLPPGAFPLTSVRKARVFPRLTRVAGADPRAFARLARFGTAIEKAFPEDRPAYLAVVGVVPEAQGRGLGTAVLGPGLATCDATGSDCYLETANARAKPLYERLGFEVLSTRRLLPGGPVHWRMRRGAGAQA